MSETGAAPRVDEPSKNMQTASRIDALFERKRAAGSAALIFFLTAGHPEAGSTIEAIRALEAGGTDLIELGIPFSDPIADGPTIQKSSQTALEGGMTVRGVLDLVRQVRETSQIPLVLFSGFNPIFHYGEARFIADAAEAGADGVLIPDLPPEEGSEIESACLEHGLKTIFLAAPTTTTERLSTICEHSTGFLYYISLRGVTGARADLPVDLRENVERIRRSTSLPLAVGFGISEPDHARRLAEIADGVVVGSALVRLIGEHAGRPDFAGCIEAYARSLAEATQSARKG
jgi:tryptophan synthase alpha chain